MSIRHWFASFKYDSSRIDQLERTDRVLRNALYEACGVPEEDWAAVAKELGPHPVADSPAGVLKQIRLAHVDVLLRRVSKPLDD